jgi:hypothetical protein
MAEAYTYLIGLAIVGLIIGTAGMLATSKSDKETWAWVGGGLVVISILIGLAWYIISTDAQDKKEEFTRWLSFKAMHDCQVTRVMHNGETCWKCNDGIEYCR